MTTDFELLDAWRAGDRAAGTELFDRQFDALYRFYRTKVSAGVDDLVQEALLACVESADTFQKRSSFRTFLFAIAKRVLYRHYARRDKEAVLDFGVSSVHDLGPSPSTLWARRDDQRRVLAALCQIPLQYQTILELYYWEGLSTEELAEVLDLPAATARTQLRRGRDRLAEVLRRLGGAEGELDALMGSLREPAPGG